MSNEQSSRTPPRSNRSIFPVSADLHVMIEAANKAGRSLVKDFGEVERLQVSKKGPSDFVSKADLDAEKIIKDELAYVRPDIGFFGEESGETEGDFESRWIVDPLDGTTNFLHGIPHWSISIAMETKGEIVAGVIYDPVKNEMFYAEKGQGAFLNRNRLRVSGRRDLSSSLFATGIPFQGVGDIDTFSKYLKATAMKISGTRRYGSAALDMAYVAAGRYEAYWEEKVLNRWDIAAGIILVREAGGMVTTMDNSTIPTTGKTSMLASNSALHDDIVEMFARA